MVHGGERCGPTGERTGVHPRRNVPPHLERQAGVRRLRRRQRSPLASAPIRLNRSLCSAAEPEAEERIPSAWHTSVIVVPRSSPDLQTLPLGEPRRRHVRLGRRRGSVLRRRAMSATGRSQDEVGCDGARSTPVDEDRGSAPAVEVSFHDPARRAAISTGAPSMRTTRPRGKQGPQARGERHVARRERGSPGGRRTGRRACVRRPRLSAPAPAVGRPPRRGRRRSPAAPSRRRLLAASGCPAPWPDRHRPDRR